MSGYIVVNIGCIECGVSSAVVGVYADKAEAERVAEVLGDKMGWRQQGQNAYEVFPLPDLGVVADEYREALK